MINVSTQIKSNISNVVNKILVVVPTYNERGNIEKLINTLFSLNRGLDILIVDDGNDGTDELVREMQRGNSHLFLIKREGKGGRGSAVVEGLKWGLQKDYDYLVEMDADMSHDPIELPKLLEQAAPDTMVIGSRYCRGSQIIGWPMKRRIFSKLANIYAGLVLGLGINDYTNGFRVYPRPPMERLNFAAVKSRGFIALSEIAYELSQLGAKFVEVPIRFVNRARGASSFSLKEIKESFLSVLKVKFRTAEIVLLGLLALSFFVGLTHGFPLTTVIGDEAPNVGGVLRTMEAKTIFPKAGDVPYATATYLVSYGFIAAYLVLAGPFFGFNIDAIKTHFIDNPHELYLVVRLSSVLLAWLAILVLHKLATRSGLKSWKDKISIIVLVMTNLLITSHFRTTKVWMFSTALTIFSIYYLYQAVTKRTNKAIVLSLVFAFLSFANFPFNFYAVAAASILLLLAFRKERKFYPALIKGLVLGAICFALVSAVNWQNIIDQARTILTGDRDLAAGLQLGVVARIFALNLQRIILLFPLLLIPILFVRRIRDRELFRIAATYLAIYLLLVSFTAIWISGTASFLRYLLPFGFFLGVLLMSLEFRTQWILPAAAGLSIIYYLFGLVYLTRPTTYNLVNDWTWKELNQENVIIVNDARWLELPLNPQSAALLEEKYCGSRCRLTIDKNLHTDFKPLVFDARRGRGALYKKLEAAAAPGTKFYLYSTLERPEFAAGKAAVFGNLSGDDYYGVDHRLGNYLDPNYFQLQNFGEQIYVYRFK